MMDSARFPSRPVPRLRFGADVVPGSRVLAAEVPVALSFDGTTQAVMMATPADLEDFALGFAATERIADPADIERLDIVPAGAGLDVQMWLVPGAGARLARRRRHMLGPVGCGLCGIESIAEALRDVAPVPPSGFRLTPAQIMAAMAALPQAQALHDATRSAHGAGWWTGETLTHLREDVGRHNALDKLAGALLRDDTDRRAGAVVLTSRVSIDLVQKVAVMGAGMIIAVSSPTADAVDLADRLGLTLVAQARPDGFEAYTHTDRIQSQVPHVR